MPKPHVPQKKAKPAVAAGGQGLAEMAVQAKQRDALLQRNHVLGEIQKTEAIYGQNLAKMLTHFQTPLKKSAPDAEIRAVFSNLEALSMAQNMFQAKLEGQPDLASAGSSAVPVSALPILQAFNDCDGYFRMYSVYAGDYMEAISRLPALEAAHPALFRKAVLGSGRPLVSFLIMPIQRTPRYALLLREVVKHTPEDDPEHEAAEECLQKMQRIVTYINKSVNDKMQRLAVTAVYGNLSVPPCLDRLAAEPARALLETLVLPHRRVLKEGAVRLFEAGQRGPALNLVEGGHLVVFNDMLLLTIKPNTAEQALHYRGQIDMRRPDCQVSRGDLLEGMGQGVREIRGSFSHIGVAHPVEWVVDFDRAVEDWTTAIDGAQHASAPPPGQVV